MMFILLTFSEVVFFLLVQDSESSEIGRTFLLAEANDYSSAFLTKAQGGGAEEEGEGVRRKEINWKLVVIVL